MSNPLPKTSDLDVSEAIYSKIVTDLSYYDERAMGVVARGWDAELQNVINAALNKLGVCIMVSSPSMSAIDDVAGGGFKATVRIDVESNALLRSSDRIDWSAYDVAGLLKVLLNGYTSSETRCLTPHDELRITDYKLARNGINETAIIILTTTI